VKEKEISMKKSYFLIISVFHRFIHVSGCNRWKVERNSVLETLFLLIRLLQIT